MYSDYSKLGLNAIAPSYFYYVPRRDADYTMGKYELQQFLYLRSHLVYQSKVHDEFLRISDYSLNNNICIY
ncbi:MAG: hypothetical protein V7K14_03655 [Nostoc sp.]|uniref:hypothetical protein n=1 Tax=Nostoc sp. TaxID=1180 RepID=UPI002FFBB919